MNRVYPPGRGATGRLLQDVTKAFVREGWHVTIITSGLVSGETREVGVRVIRVKGAEKPESMRAYVWIWLKMFFAALFTERRHVVMTMSDPPMLLVLGAFISKIKRCRHVNWCHDIYPDVVPVLGMKFPSFVLKFLKVMRRHAMKSADSILVCGRCMKEYLIADGIDAKRIAVVPNWPEKELVSVGDKGSIQEAHNVQDARAFEKQVKSKQRFRILYAGNIGLVHPTEVILEAAQRLQEAGHDIEFVFVGDGPRFDEIARKRSSRGLDNIRFLPRQPISRLWEVLESGDMHLITMKGEAEGLVVPSKFYAALAVGRPCVFIGPKDCEVGRIISEFKSGVVIPQGDVEHLVASIILFRKNGDAWFAAHKGALAAREVFTPELSIDKLIENVWAVVKQDLES